MTPSGSAAPDESQALGLDIGTTNTKVALVAVDRASGRVRVLASAAAQTPHPADLPDRLAELLGSIRRDRPDARVRAIGIASMAETGVPLGSDRRPLGGWLRWDARSGAGQVGWLSASLGMSALFAATGVRLAGKTPLAVWAALRQSEPDRFQAMRAWAGAADLAGLALTGELVTDHTLAGRTGAYRLPTGVWTANSRTVVPGRAVGVVAGGGTDAEADDAPGAETHADADGAPGAGTCAGAGYAAGAGADARDARAPGAPHDTAGAVWPQTYAADLLGAVGLSPRQMPLVATPGARLAAGSAARWAEWGIEPGTPVVIAGHDHAVGAWAAGVRQPGQAADSIGTAEAIYLVLRSPADQSTRHPAAPPLDPERVRLQGMSVAATVDGGLALIAGHAAAGGAVAAWLAERAQGLDPDGLAALAATAWPGPPDLFVLPYPGGRQCPSPNTAAGLTVIESTPHGPAEQAAALFEGLALHAAWMLREGARLGGLKPRGVTLLGGPALSNPVWMAAKRALTPDLAAVAAPEPVAAGAAVFALVNAGPETAGPEPVGRPRADQGAPAPSRPAIRAAAAIRAAGGGESPAAAAETSPPSIGATSRPSAPELSRRPLAVDATADPPADPPTDPKGAGKPATGRSPGADGREPPSRDWGRRLDAFVAAATADKPLTEEEP